MYMQLHRKVSCRERRKDRPECRDDGEKVQKCKMCFEGGEKKDPLEVVRGRERVRDRRNVRKGSVYSERRMYFEGHMYLCFKRGCHSLEEKGVGL